MSLLMHGLLTSNGYVMGPGQYVADDLGAGTRLLVTPQDGFSPIDINLLSWGLHSHQVGVSVRNRIGGVGVGPTLFAEDTNHRDVFTPGSAIVPAVTVGNIDSGARWGLDATFTFREGYGGAGLCWEYVPVNSADAGKQIMGIGGTALCTFRSAIGTTMGAPVDYLFAPFTFPRAVMYWSFGIPRFENQGWFASPFETVADIIAQMAVTPSYGNGICPGAWPWLTPGTFQDFKLICKTAPTSAATLGFRKNGSTAFSFDVVAGTRVYTNASVILANTGDLFCWQCTQATENLDAQLLWTFKRGLPTGIGYGEGGYGEGGYG